MKTTDASRTRRRMGDAKVALGEDGPIWWDDGEPDLSRRLVKNTQAALVVVSHIAPAQHRQDSGLKTRKPLILSAPCSASPRIIDEPITGTDRR